MKLKLSNLILGQDEAESLKHLSKTQRKAILDLCDHIRLTAYAKESRDAATRFKKVVRAATLGSDNMLDSDKNPIASGIERTISYFHADT